VKFGKMLDRLTGLERPPGYDLTYPPDPVGEASRHNGDCVDCHRSIADEFYMVQDSVWKRARMEPCGGFLCIGCLEKRIGRRLRARDFTDCPLNDLNFVKPNGEPGRKSARLRNRLGGAR
jgi:hypothetical protein